MSIFSTGRDGEDGTSFMLFAATTESADRRYQSSIYNCSTSTAPGIGLREYAAPGFALRRPLPARSQTLTRPHWGIFKRPELGIFQLTMT